MLENIVTIFFSVIETIAAIFICSAFFNEKRNRKKYIIPVVTLTVLSFILLYNSPLFTTHFSIKMIVVLCLYLFMIEWLYEGKFVVKLTLAIVILVFIYSIDVLAISISMFIFKIPYELIINFNNINILISMLSKYLLLSVSMVLNKMSSINKKEIRISFYEWIQLLLYPIVTLLIILVFLEIVLIQNIVSELMIITVMAMILANIVIFIVINKLEDDKRVKEENIILHQQIKTEMNNVVALVDAYDEQRKLTHDFSNHLSVIESLTEQNELERLNTYISTLSRNLKDNALPVKTNNLIIDAILNQKYNIAVKNNIMMEFYINDLSKFPMKDEDLVIVLTNALDNALEACLKLSGYKVIQTKITDSDTDAIISIKNTYSKELYEKQKTIKNNVVSAHGFGMKNILTIAKKYDAYLATKNDDMWFQITIRIPKQ